MYAYSNDSFDHFDLRVQDVLRRGFVKSIARQMILSPIGLKIAGTKIIAGSTAMATSMLRSSVAGVERLIPRATVQDSLTKRHIPTVGLHAWNDRLTRRSGKYKPVPSRDFTNGVSMND